MNKLREPIILKFERLDFIVDIDKQVLRQTNKPEHEISFINHMTDMGDHYVLAWDEQQQTVAADPAKGEPLIIDQLIWLDPEGMSAKYSIPVERLQTMSDFEVIVDQDALQQRRDGILPQIDIAGEKFVVDTRLQELRHAEFFAPVLSLKSFDLTDDGWHYTAFYEPIMKQVVGIDPKLTEFPEGILQIRIPNEIGLDPVATARQYGMDERELLRRYPIRKDLKAELIPLGETGLPRLIQQNRDELKRQHEANMQKARPRQRPRF